jgi:hypothetical protein
VGPVLGVSTAVDEAFHWMIQLSGRVAESPQPGLWEVEAEVVDAADHGVPEAAGGHGERKRRKNGSASAS